MDADQKTESLATLVQDVEKGQVTLPEFQRDFVWEIQKTYDLFDSFVLNIFIGSLIYGIPSFDITVREIDTRPRVGKGSRKKLLLVSHTKEQIEKLVQVHGFRLLLDGQQRVTSIFRALKGYDDVYLILKHEDMLDPNVKAIDTGKRALEQVLDEFRGDAPQGRVAIRLSDVYKMLHGDMPRDKDKVAPFMQSSKLVYSTPKEAEESQEFIAYLTQAKNLEHLFRQEKLVSYYLLNTDQERFALFFERSNSKGIQLSFIDILAAKLYSGFNLRQYIEEFKEDNPTVPLNREVIVRTISYIISEGKDTGRGFILSKLTTVHFNDHWKHVTELYCRCYEYLIANHMIVSHAWLPYENMLIPMMAFLRHVPHWNFANISEKQQSILTLWYWLAILSRRYSSAAQTYVLEDARVLEAVAQNDFSTTVGLLKKLPSDVQTVEDLRSVHKQYDAVYKGVLNFINYYSGGLIGWESSAVVSAKDDIDDHHIFPKDFLRKKLKDSDSDNGIDIDCVINRSLIPRLANIKASNKPPSEYMQNLRAQNNKLDEALAKHMVPAEIIDGTYDDVFEIFLDDRGTLIIQALKSAVLDKRAAMLAELDQ